MTLTDLEYKDPLRLAWTPSVRPVSAALTEPGLIRDDDPVHLHRAVAEAMTVNETSFFRDRTTFDMLRDRILPDLIDRRRSSRRLRIWSAACSTGQEAYSLAMLLWEHLPEIMDWDLQILGTDISWRVLEYARKGRYSRLEVNHGLPARMLLKHMTRSDEGWQVNPGPRAMCKFQRLNLCASLAGLPVFDLILLRNVLFYFELRDHAALFGAVHHHMAEDGILVLGAVEQAEDATRLFEPEISGQAIFYRLAKVL